MWFIVENDEEQEILESPDYPAMSSSGGKWTSCSAGYESKERLWKDNGILDKPCVICNRWVKTTYHNNERMISKNMCFRCNLWDERAGQVRERNMIVDGNWYSVADEKKNWPNSCRGFGGHRFVFEKNGEKIESTNVWFGGKIPSYFLTRIPDNAIRIL